jgi:hypothetical protein
MSGIPKLAVLKQSDLARVECVSKNQILQGVKVSVLDTDAVQLKIK